MMYCRGRHLSSRRSFLLGGGALAALALRAPAEARERARHLVLAPSNLGLRPEESGAEPGTWRAPEVLMAAGLETRVGADRVVQLPRPSYDAQAQAGTRIRNGHTLRRFSLDLAGEVR